MLTGECDVSMLRVDRIQKEKVADSKISRNMWTWLNLCTGVRLQGQKINTK